MATAGNTGIRPDHVIIWCDRNMAVEGNNEASKAVLNEHGDLNASQLRESGSVSEIDRLICNINLDLNNRRYHRLIRSPLRMCTNESECLKYIHDSIEAGKQPFLITSGEKGALLIPQLRDESTGKILQILSGHTYVFCAQRHLHENWMKPFQNDIEVYDDEKGVFGKVLLDIGIHYLTKGQETTGNPAAATQYFHWAYRLIGSATTVDGINRNDYLTIIRDELVDLNAPVEYDSDNVATQAEDVY